MHDWKTGPHVPKIAHLRSTVLFNKVLESQTKFRMQTKVEKNMIISFTLCV